MNFGIDISTYQNGIDLKKAKDEGIEFVIIRAGFTGYANKTMAIDDRFNEHYTNAKKNNINVGVYFYSRATTYDEGKKEAEFLYNNCLKNKTFEYPIFIDVEDTYYQFNTTKDEIDNAITGFCEYIESKNGYAGVYCNLNWANNHMNYDKLSKKFDFWLAYWGNESPNRNKYGNYGIWQYGGETNYIRSNKVANMICDQNYSYKNYKDIMNNMHLNNFIIEDNNTISDDIKEENKEVKIIDKTIKNKETYIKNNTIKKNYIYLFNLIKKIIIYIFSKLKKEI